MAMLYIWDFGDGATSLLENPSHTYSTVGTYDVTFTADDGQQSATVHKTAYVTTTAPPVPLTWTINTTQASMMYWNQYQASSLIPSPAAIGGKMNNQATNNTTFVGDYSCSVSTGTYQTFRHNVFIPNTGNYCVEWLIGALGTGHNFQVGYWRWSFNNVFNPNIVRGGGYHGYPSWRNNGAVQIDNSTVNPVVPAATYGVGDRLGILVNMNTMRAQFFKNGVDPFGITYAFTGTDQAVFMAGFIP